MVPVIKQIVWSALTNSAKNFSSTSTHLAEATCTKLCSQNGVRTITLSGPSRNALSLRMMEEITHHITFEQNDVALRVIVIKAEGPMFSAGHNLKELMADSGRELHNSVFKTSSKLMLSILQSPVPVIACVHGLAAASGCQLVAGCDMAICSENATFSTPGAQVGIFCSTPGIALARVVPSKVAADMLFTGESISAQEALRHGLVSRVVPEDKLDEEVSKVTTSIIAKSRAVIELGKKFYYSQIQSDIHTAYRLGEKVMVSNVSMVDGQEGISSFLGKRKPQWKHTEE